MGGCLYHQGLELVDPGHGSGTTMCRNEPGSVAGMVGKGVFLFMGFFLMGAGYLTWLESIS